MGNRVLTVLAFVGLFLSVYFLRITHNDIWFLSFLIFLVIFCLKLADSINEIRSPSEDLLPIAVHVFAVLLFLYGVFASFFSWNKPDATLLILLGMPFLLALSPYLALMLFLGPMVIFSKIVEFFKNLFIW